MIAIFFALSASYNFDSCKVMRATNQSLISNCHLDILHTNALQSIKILLDFRFRNSGFEAA